MRLILLFLLLGLALPAVAQEADKIFPYDYHVRDLDNGLRVIVIPTDYPNIVSLYVPVSVGSRNEVEPGKSGFAHFFEHMMFRGTKNFSAAAYQDIMKNAGANDNAYTTDDRTVYHTTFSKEDLETMLEVHGDRFQNLEYADPEFRTEALAVLGEYNKNSADPVSKLLEVQRATAFDAHTYRHTTMGFIEDIEAMPDQFDYSRTFFDRFYRPEYSTVMVVGDVEPDNVFTLVEKYWGDWERGSYQAEIPVEPAPSGPRYAHVDWESETLPWVSVGFRGPASYGADDADMRALDIIASYAFSSSSDLYQKLVVDEQVVDQLWSHFPDRADPNLVSVFARVKDPADVWRVRDEIQQTLADLRADGVDAERMDAIKSRLKYGFANGLDSSPSIAGALASYVAVTRDIETVNEVYARYDALTPADVQAAAEAYFTDRAMIVTTLSHGELAEIDSEVGTVDGLAERDMGAASASSGGALFETVAQPSSSPLVDLRFLFLTGAADDPEGKEGLAELTARMVADAGSQGLTYSMIQQELFPLASGFWTQVDKEMTVFSGRTHRDNLDRYYPIIASQLLNPGFRTEDFERVKSGLVNEIRVGLRSNNDEELGKEVLYEMIYADHAYGHLNLGHVEAVEALTLDDVRDFYESNYTQRNLVFGYSGDAPEAFVGHVQADLAGLPAGEITRHAPITQPAVPEGMQVTLVDKNTRSAAISMGFPIEVTRSHPDFPALWLVRSYFGEHRNLVSHLFQRIREERGMNYGDYAYIEYFPRGMFLNQPDNNLGRFSQIFQIWIRPVPPEQTHFAIRAAKYELDKLVRDGMSQDDFDATKNFLLKYVNVLTQSQDRQIGYALDSKFYGTADFGTFIREGIENLTLEDANRVIREHLDSESMALVVVTPDAAELADKLAEDTPSPMTYNAPKPDEIYVEDEVIEQYPLGIDREDIRVVPVGEVFEGRVFMTMR